jgi:signal peptidase
MSGAHALAVRHRPRRTLRRTAHIMRAVLFNLAALLGAVCITLVVLAFTFHISLVLFRTGSMSPTIPTGSLAVVKRIPADQARVGDVVTVDRPDGQLPMTHRVVSVTPAADGVSTLVLKGDANPAADAAPYQVKTVRLVLWHAPRLARLIVWFSRPLVLGTITVLIAALVTWTMWPTRDDPDDGKAAVTKPADVAGAADAGQSQVEPR